MLHGTSLVDVAREAAPPVDSAFPSGERVERVGRMHRTCNHIAARIEDHERMGRIRFAHTDDAALGLIEPVDVNFAQSGAHGPFNHNVARTGVDRHDAA